MQKKTSMHPVDLKMTFENDYIDADVAILHECVFFSNSNIIVVLEKGKERRKI